MKLNLRTTILLLCLLGAGTTLLPWYRITMYPDTAEIIGIDTWQGKVALAVFCLSAMLMLMTRSLAATPRWRPPCLIAAGIAAAVVIGLFLVQKKPSIRIVVQEGGRFAEDLTEEDIRRISTNLRFEAPANFALALALVVLGIVEWRTRGRDTLIDSGIAKSQPGSAEKRSRIRKNSG